MAQVNVDLSEYDMLREAKTKAESQVKELTEEVKKLKDNAANVVVRNRYYIPMIDYKEGAKRLIQRLGSRGLSWLFTESERMRQSSYLGDPFMPQAYNTEAIQQLAATIELSVQDLVKLKSTYIEDATITEIRGFDEFSETIKAKLELEYRAALEEKKSRLDREMELYNTEKLKVDEAVEKAVNETKDTLNKKHDKKVKELEDKQEDLEKTIKDLEEQLKEASKSSEEKLAEAMAKLKAAEEEVAKYSTPRKKLFGIF